ncbi:MAG: translation initiation factor IF-2, partial [Oscillospiraceae bacterium]|nr:translation initiation factor IF-2 [Oscillospiraceae bacterium]
MPMMEKYRVHEVAKDLGVPSKDVLELLGKYFSDVKKHMTALEPKELSVIFEYYTAKTAVDSLDAFFKSGQERREALAKVRAEEKAKADAAKAAAKAEAAKQAKAKKAAEKPKAAAAGKVQAQQKAGPARTAAPKQQPAKPQIGLVKAAQKPAVQQRTAQDRQAQFRQGQRMSEQRAANAQQRAQQQRPRRGGQRAGGPMPQGALPQGVASTEVITEAAVKDRVDMRSASVNLERYNERYESIAPTNLAKKDTGVRKQKLNQKSAQRGKPFMSRKDREQQKLKRLEMERDRRNKLEITIPEEISVTELAGRLKVQAAELVKRLMGLGVMASAGQLIDYDTAAMVAMEIGAKVSPEVIITIEDRLFEETGDSEDALEGRPPVVVVMGHVDHGKTSLLDCIRDANVTAGEAGGITQHIGAYQTDIHGKKITFLDTPGHAAFTSMRARGAGVTDIAILVVAADDGVMPQTVEAINHAKAAEVSIIVAINKMDKPEANPDRIKTQLSEQQLIPEDWGGETIYVEVSALKKEGIDKLLECILLEAELLDLKANFDRSAEGKILESRIDHGRGVVATVMVEKGTLKIGDSFVAGVWPGKVRALFNDKGEKVEEATPSMPIEILGFEGIPNAGDPLQVVDDEKTARTVSAKRQELKRFEDAKNIRKITLDNLHDTISEGAIQELKVIIKADVQGSAEALRSSLEKLSTNEIRLYVIQALPGAINEGDVDLASASNAIIIGFNVRPVPKAKALADQEKVDIRRYNVIYKAVEEIHQAMEGMLSPDTREELIATVEVRDTFKTPKFGVIAGCYVLSGTVKRSASVHVMRDNISIHTGKIESLRRF